VDENIDHEFPNAVHNLGVWRRSENLNGQFYALLIIQFAICPAEISEIVKR
jgi:hypothetical protein